MFVQLQNVNYSTTFGFSKKIRVLTEATKAKISASKKGIPCPEEVKKKISAAMKGRIFSTKHRENLSQAMKKVRKEKPEITQMHKDAQNILWNSTPGEQVKAAMAKQYTNSSIGVKKVVYAKTQGEQLSIKEQGIDLGFWSGFWRDNTEM